MTTWRSNPNRPSMESPAYQALLTDGCRLNQDLKKAQEELELLLLERMPVDDMPRA